MDFLLTLTTVQDRDYYDLAVLHYVSQTRTDTLDADIKYDASILCDYESWGKLKSSYQPTHVVTAITYGGNAHFVFEKKIDIDDVINEIGGHLHAKYKQAVFEIEGSFTLNNTDVTSYLSNVSNIKV